MDRDRLQRFIREVFWNIDAVTAHHQRMLDRLFARQREQHPVVLSITDIILDGWCLSLVVAGDNLLMNSPVCLQFRDDYESYIKHYPCVHYHRLY
jgi:RHO1 GDP-GTP exchange protein 1/2